MGGTLLLATAVVSLAVFGTLVARLLGLGSLPRSCLASYVLAWAGLATTAAVLSLPAWLSRWSLLLGLALLAILSIGVSLVRAGPPVPSAGVAWRETLHDPIVRTLAAAVAAAGLYLGALAFFTTPNDWDGLAYHEPRALLWNERGRVGYVLPGNDPRLNGNPPISEIGLYLTMLVPRSERFAALPQYVALAACLLAVMLVARRVGLSRGEAAYGGLVFATLPIVFLQGAAVLNDLVVASFLLAAIVFLSGRARAELALGSIALGLALGTKISAVLALPLLVGVVLALGPRGRRPSALLACGLGVVLGSPWLILNLFQTGSLDGNLGETTGQRAGHSVGEIVSSVRALVFDVDDTSGFRGANLGVAVVVGAALCVAAAVGVRRAWPSTVTGALVAGGLLAALTPAVLRALEGPTRYLWVHFWFKIGREQIALDHGDAWNVQSLADTSVSWYGAVGAVVIVGGFAAALVGMRRRIVPRATVLLAAAPAVLIAIFALTIVYDPWRGRLLIFGVGLAAAAWGWTLRVRWLATGVAALCIATLALSLVDSFTKPSGLGLFVAAETRSIWHRDRIETLTVIRDYDGTPALLRAVEADVPPDAELAVATTIDTFLAPLAGPRLSRTLRLVADGGRVPEGAEWLVSRTPAWATGCPAAWRVVYADRPEGWRLLRRVAVDACGTGSRL